MWTVVYMAQNQEVVETLKSILEQEGLLVKVRPVSRSDDGEGTCFEVLVPESEVEEAHGIIIEKGFLSQQ